MTVGQVLVGSGADAVWWTREPANVRIDPYSQSMHNLVRVIAEDRGNAQPTTPAAWAFASLPAATVTSAQQPGGRARG